MSDSEDEKKTRNKRNTAVMLWGKKKASQSQIDDVLKNLKITTKKVPKSTKKDSKTVKEQRTHYDPTLEYTTDDIEFLEQQAEKLNDDYDNQVFNALEDPNVQKYYDIKNLDKLDDDQKEEILYKMVDKIERLIEVLKDYRGDTKGEGLDTDSDEEDARRMDAMFDRMEKAIAKREAEEAKNPTKKKEPPKKKVYERTESDDEDERLFDERYDRVMKKLDELENKGTKKKTKAKQEAKKRVEKGSEEAKAKMAKLTAIRQAKKVEKDKVKEKEKQTKKAEKEAKKKPFYYIGPVPSGYRKATEDEALLNDMVGELGEHEVNPQKLKYYEKYNILLTPDRTPSQIVITLKAFHKRVDGIFTDIDILESQLRSAQSGEDIERLRDKIKQRKNLNKFFSKTEEGKRFKVQLEKLKDNNYAKGIEEKLKAKEQELKDIKKIYRYYQKLLEQKSGKKQELLTEFKRKVPEYIPPKESKPEPPRAPPKSTLELIRDDLIRLSKERKANEPPPKTTHTFENYKGRVEIPKKYFDKKMVLHPKYAQKLHSKDILLHPHHYDKEHTEKYFYKHIKESSRLPKGEGIGTYDLQKLLKQSYNPELGNVGDYMVDDELSNPTTQVYRNKNTDKIYVVHRGTKGGRDWLNNLVYGLSPSLYKWTDRYKNAKQVQDKAMDKYKGYDIDVLGHSQGSKLAEMISKDNKNVKNIITYNRPQGFMENIRSKPKNLHDIKTSFDPVSPLVPYQRGNQSVIIPSQTYNPLHEHRTERILELPDQVIGTGFVNRKPDLNHHSIVQSVIFDRPTWTKPRAIRWLKENNYYHDDVDSKTTQIRFRQYNPQDFREYHYISKPLKDKGILLIIAMKNAHGGTVHRSCGQGFMHNNVEHFTPNEALLKNTNLITHHVQQAIKEHKALAKEAKGTLAKTKALNKTSLKRALKGSQEARDRMARLRAMKKK